MSAPIKTILVTGGTRGLGLAVTKRLAESGYRVIATGRSCTPELERLTSSCDVHFESLDLGKHDEIHNFVIRVTAAHGHLFGLVNNAAIGHDGILATMHDSQIESLISVNITGTILLTKYAVRSMLLRREGRVINISPPEALRSCLSAYSREQQNSR